MISQLTLNDSLPQQCQHFYLTEEDGVIPYSRQLREFTGSISATILMQRLEFHFKNHPDGFSKFLTKNSKTFTNRSTSSWEEELGFTKEEFVSTFNYIGVRHITKDRYQKAMHPFFNSKNQEKYYCNYYDRHSGLTWYYRNHLLVDSLAKELLTYKD